MNQTFDLNAAIRRVPDFPKPGILFYDITSVLTNPAAFSYCVESMVDRYKEMDLDAIAGIESRGFLFAAPLALALGKPLVLIRKKGKLPGETYQKSYDLEYGQDTVELHKADVQPGQRVLVIDDLVATGGTLEASAALLREIGCVVPEVFCVIGLPFLNFRERMDPTPVRTLVEFASE